MYVTQPKYSIERLPDDFAGKGSLCESVLIMWVFGVIVYTEIVVFIVNVASKQSWFNFDLVTVILFLSELFNHYKFIKVCWHKFYDIWLLYFVVSGVVHCGNIMK